jgi:hypothetical protein
MTYSAGGLIQATDYNSFAVNSNSGNVNRTWANGVPSGDPASYGWGQTALPLVSAGGVVTATNWASLVNTISSMASQTGTTITSRVAPVTGNLIQILAALATDLSNIRTNRLNAVANGSQFTGWTGTNSKTAATSGATWSFTVTNTVTFASADAARYFFNAGGRIKLDVSKTATGALGDPEWNDLANTLCGDIFFTAGTTQTISGASYTGTTKVGGTGTPNVLATTTGFYNLTAGAAATIIYKQFADTVPYTSNFIQHSVALNAASTVLTFTTLWSASDGDAISGGTAAVAATPGTAPCAICTYFPPSTTYLTTASWGTPTVAASTV